MLPMLLARHALTVSLKAASEKLPSLPNVICGASVRKRRARGVRARV
jgi:hypothetical protein